MGWGCCPSSDKADSCTNSISQGPVWISWSEQYNWQVSQTHSCTSTYLLDDTILKRTKMLIFSFRSLSGGGWEFISPTLVHMRKSRNASKQRQIPTCSQGLPHWPYRNRRAFAVIGSGNKHGPAVTAAHNNCSLNTFKYPGEISQMRAKSP